jgi:formylglycine-generating enzyme required for sulfatase activity/serine/threonine protein kinase
MPLATLVPGQIFAGDFLVVRPLSQGGMGAVYVVEQQSTGKPRALKLMQPELVADARLRKRFEQEARVAARIESEHVVEVIGAGVDAATGTPWLAMELLQGEELAAYVARRGPLPAAEVLEIFAQLTHALGAAHRAGIVHRDLKPENVFLATSRRSGAAFTVKILDFGIAKMTAEAQTSATAALGTPLWMAPEQAESRGTITPAADVWALGLIAFRLLAGQAYWRTASSENPSVPALMKEVLFDEIIPPSARAREVTNVPLPPGFDGWFARCVARRADERYPDATSAFAALAPLLGGPTSAFTAPTQLAHAPPSQSAPRSAQAPQKTPVPPTRVAERTQLASSAPEPPAPPFGATPHASSATAPQPSRPSSGRRTGLIVAGVLVLAASGAAVGLLLARGGDGGAKEHAAKPQAELDEEAPAKKPIKNGTATKAAAASAPSATVSTLAPNEPPKVAPSGMVHVPAGVFVMGADDGDASDGPARKVTITSGFFLDLTETSVTQYARCVVAGLCTASDVHGTSDEDAEKHRPMCNANDPARAWEPINCVDQGQAAAYCKHVHKRLPTEAEWEYAARGADGRVYPWGNEPPACTRGAFGGCRTLETRTTKGGSYPSGASPFGALDMAGNVWEWTVDGWSVPSAGPATDPQTPLTGDFGVLRGGSWDFAPTSAKAAHRLKFHRRIGHVSTGFRCARDE